MKRRNANALKKENKRLQRSAAGWEATARLEAQNKDDRTDDCATAEGRVYELTEQYHELAVERDTLRAMLEKMVRSTGPTDPLLDRHLVRPSLALWKQARQALEETEK